MTVDEHKHRDQDDPVERTCTVGLRSNLRRLSSYGLLAFLAVAVLIVMLLLFGPFLPNLRERQARQQAAEGYLRSVGLPLYPHAALVDRLGRFERESAGERLISSHAVFHSKDQFDAVKTWYETALPSREWTHRAWADRRIAQDWQATRSADGTSYHVSVNTPTGAGFTAIVYTVTSTH